MMPLVLILIFCLLGVSRQALALSYSTPDDATMRLAAHDIETYREKNGRLPPSWAELDHGRLQPRDISDPVEPTKRYAFLPPGSWPKKPGENVEIFLISRRPFRNLTLRELPLVSILLPMAHQRTLTAPLRYGLSIDARGYIRRVDIPEEQVQRMFKEQGLQLPIADETLERPWIRKIERSRNRAKAIAAGSMVLLTVAAGFFLRRFSKRYGTARCS